MRLATRWLAMQAGMHAHACTAGLALLGSCLIACAGGQSGDPGQRSDGGSGPNLPDSGHTMGDDEPASRCELERWQGPSAPRITERCELAEDGSPGTRFVCSCQDEDAREVDASSACKALEQACNVDLRARRFCESTDLGTCWPGSEADDWSCQCQGESELRAVESSDCMQGLLDTCGERCEGTFGACEQALGQSEFLCACSWAPNAWVGGFVPAGSSCEEHLQAVCSASCQGPAGRCEVSETFELGCQCSDGSEQTESLVLDAAYDDGVCFSRLEAICGAEHRAPVEGCESEHEGVHGGCEALPKVLQPSDPPPEGFDYACFCDGTDLPVRSATGCYHALLDACPGAIAEAEIPEITAGQLGALCEEPASCERGACYVPGNDTDPICSAPCETDADCGEGSLCAFIGADAGYCFATCTSDVYCGLLNTALANPLECMDRVDVSQKNLSGDDESGRICVQRSEP